MLSPSIGFKISCVEIFPAPCLLYIYSPYISFRFKLYYKYTNTNYVQLIKREDEEKSRHIIFLPFV